MIRSGFTARAILAASAAFAFSAPALAQDSPSDPALAAEADDDDQIITVTAQKREEDVQDVPISISVVSGEEMQQRGASELADYAAYIPGVQVDNPGEPGRSTVILRGLAPQTGSATTGIYLDDSPVTPSGLYNVSGQFTLDLLPYDIQRIEVLRGPQGTVYGANTIGGLLKYVTVAPSLTTFSARGGVELFETRHAGETGYSFGAMVNVPIIPDVLGITASYSQRKTPGFVDNITTGVDDFNESKQEGGRVSLLWRPTPELTIRLQAMKQNIKSEGGSGIITTIDGDPIEPGAGYYSNDTPIPTPFRNEIQYYSGSIDYDFGFASLTSVTAYLKSHVLNTQDASGAFGEPWPGGLAAFPTNLFQKKFTQEVRLTSPSSDRFEWLLGLFYTNEDNTNEQVVHPLDENFEVIEALDPFITAALPNTYKEYAVYGNGTYKFNDHFHLTGGLRWARNEQTFRQILEFPLGGVSQNFPGASHEEVVTYSASPQFHLNKDTMFYFRVAKGYRPGGPNVDIPGLDLPQMAESDTVMNYELGLKTRLADDMIAIDMAAFRMDWDNMQITVSDAGFSGIANAGSVRTQGVEASLTVFPVPGLSINANGAWIERAECTETTDECAEGGRLGRIPKFSGSFSANYQFDVSDNIEARFGASVRHVGTRLSQVSRILGTDPDGAGPLPAPIIDNPDSLSIAGNTQLDLNASVTLNERFTLRAYARNVTDEQGAQGRNILENRPNPPGFISLSPLRPRTVGLALDVRF